MKIKTLIAGVASIAAAALTLTAPAKAGDYNGDFMIRLQGTQLWTQDDLKSLNSSALGDLKALGYDTKVSDEFLPTLTLTYFLNKNIGIELFCCFATASATLKAPGGATVGEVASSWMFPPALTLQYHFDGMGGFKPYVGVGAQYIHFFSTDGGDNALNATKVKLDDAFGVVVQAGFDMQLGGGWYANFDVKKSWLDTTGHWSNAATLGANNVTAKVDLDPLTVSAGVGYRFNLSDIFGSRSSAAPLK